MKKKIDCNETISRRWRKSHKASQQKKIKISESCAICEKKLTQIAQITQIIV